MAEPGTGEQAEPVLDIDVMGCRDYKRRRLAASVSPPLVFAKSTNSTQ